MGMNYRVEVVPRTDGSVCGVELEKVEVYDGEGRLLATYTGDGSAYVGDASKAYYKACSSGAVYVVAAIAYMRPDVNAPWDETYVLATPIGNGAYVASFRYREKESYLRAEA